MYWYNDLAAFCAGLFLANAVPHFVHGISGNRFPTPFAHPPGRGLSSPTLNVAWALLNLLAGYVLFRAGGVAGGKIIAPILFFAGVTVISLAMSVTFSKKHPG